jgi:hypothetical protein
VIITKFNFLGDFVYGKGMCNAVFAFVLYLMKHIWPRYMPKINFAWVVILLHNTGLCVQLHRASETNSAILIQKEWLSKKVPYSDMYDKANIAAHIIILILIKCTYK